ncbi:hypothetical protein OXX79_002064 [Metschnikowia pulcherrima]
MDVCYKKVMRNGSVAQKFRIGYSNPGQFKHTPASIAARDPAAEIQKPDGIPLELSSTHHDSNCARCYKLKKKCSRTYPRCDYCSRSDATCEYIDRRKRRLRFEEVTQPSSGSSQDEAKKSILIASLVNHEDEPFKNIDASPSVPVAANPEPGSSKTHSRMAPKRAKSAVSVPRNVVASSICGRTDTGSNIHEELLAVRPIEDANLPSAFVHTFFASYEYKYPFLGRASIFHKIENFKFEAETLVPLDVYLVMAIGCLVFDANFGTAHYRNVFSDSFVESIVDMISYDIQSEEDIHKAHLLILLSIYAVNVGNTMLIWNIVGYLDRLVLFLSDFTGKREACMRKRCFWTIFNLDKELSLLLDKPSQFIPTQIIRVSSDFSDTLAENESEKCVSFMEHTVMLHKLQDRALSCRLGLAPTEKEHLTSFSADLESWRVGVSSLIHTEYAESSLLQNYIGLVNLDYYYLLIELDQLSSTESFQFTLQFLSNSFSLLLSESSAKKECGGTSIYSLFWFLKFFKVIDYGVASLLRILNGANRSEWQMRLSDFHGNVQLEMNLLKFLLNSKSRPPTFVPRLESYLGRLKTLSQKLVLFNPLAGQEKDIEALRSDISALFEYKEKA